MQYTEEPDGIDVGPLIEALRNHERDADAARMAVETLVAEGILGRLADVPLLHAALLAYPIPARQNTGHWFDDEMTKCRIMDYLRDIGPAAAPATPTLIAVLLDGEGYRDTRHTAKETLWGIGLPETVEALIAQIRSRDSEEELYSLLDVLSGMQRESLTAVSELDELLRELSAHPAEWLRDEARYVARVSRAD